MFCDYGCGNKWVYQFSDGTQCCSENIKNCPGYKKEMEETLSNINIIEDKETPVNERSFDKIKPNTIFYGEVDTDKRELLIKVNTHTLYSFTSQRNWTCNGSVTIADFEEVDIDIHVKRIIKQN